MKFTNKFLNNDLKLFHYWFPSILIIGFKTIPAGRNISEYYGFSGGRNCWGVCCY